MDRVHGGGKIGPAAGFHQISRYPFPQLWNPLQRAFDRPSERLWRQAGCQRVYRFHLRHFPAILRAHDTVWMRHLRLALADFDPAADNPPFAGRQHAADIIVPRMEEDKLQPAAVILGDHPPGTTASRGWLVMLDDKNLEGGDAAVNKVSQRRPCAPVDQPDGKVAQQVYHMRADALLKNPCQLWPHAGQHRGCGEQAIDFSGASWMHACSVRQRWRNCSLPESRFQDKRTDEVRCSRGGGATCCPQWQQMFCFAAI